MGAIKSNKKILTKILSALLAVILGILCAFLVSCQTRPVWNEMSYIELTESLSQESSQDEPLLDQFSSHESSSNESLQDESSQDETSQSESSQNESSQNESSQNESSQGEASQDESSSTDTQSEVPTESTQLQTESTSQSEPSETTAPPTIIKEYSPTKTKTLSAGSSLAVTVLARTDSTKVTATFNGKTITLKRESDGVKADGTVEKFVNYKGSFTLPTGNEEDVKLGGVTFSATWKEHTKKITTPSIICLKDEKLANSTVVEIVTESAETFNGNTTNDYSDPRLSYLPKGTIDFKVGETIYDSESGKYYYKMRFGRRVYVSKPNPPDENDIVVSKAYKGSVPDTNEISIASTNVSGHHTYITFDTLWKAPFTVNIAPQNYTNPAQNDFTVQSTTYSYVDIKFCYTKAIDGKLTIPKSNPLFLASKIIPEEDGYVLRIYLKRVGAFYGWDAYYNQKGQLVFKFLNPTKADKTEKNEYGANLKGINILLDVGHGGKDIGASGLKPETMPEAERNLLLAKLLKNELEKMGANVVMTRSSDKAVTSEDRCSALRKVSPDLCIAIHHDASENSSKNGCGVFCFNAFSHKATLNVYKRTAASKIYKNTYKKWHYFYLARVSSCPVVLIENGYISNSTDFKGISNYKTNVKKAETIAQSVADYFISIP